MKYTRLTKEQLEELHPEFINFLATQSIDKAEWDSIKANSPEIVEQELDVFSDLIWEGVLTRATYLEYFSKNHVFLFDCKADQIRIAIEPETRCTIKHQSDDPRFPGRKPRRMGC